MSQDLRIRYSVSVDDIVEWNIYHLKHSPAMRSANRRQQFFFAIFILGFSIMVDLLAGKLSWGPIGAVLIFLVFMRFLHIPLTRKYIKWMYAHGKGRGVICEHTLEITDDGILETTDVNQNKAFWKGIDRIEETPDLGMIYTGITNAYIIPAKGVLEGTYETFMTELRKRFAAQSSGAPAAGS